MFDDKKKLIALAVAGAFVLPVAAQEKSEVVIYGKLYPEFTVLSGSGATPAGTTGLSTLARTPSGLNAKSRNSVDASNSRLGFRGKEDLGNGLSAIWQIESTVPIDSGGGLLATRESFVGLKGGFGTVRLGFMDSVYKKLGDPLKFLGLASGNHVSTSNIISARMPFGTSSAGSFHLRAPNALWYETPTMGGTTLYAQYSPSSQESAVPNASSKKEFWSLGAKYQVGPLYLALTHEIHKDFFGGSLGSPSALSNVTSANLATGLIGNVHSDDTSTRASVMYKWGKAKVSLDVASFDYSESGGAAGKFQNYKNNRWALEWEQLWNGPWRTAAAYSSSSAGSCSLFGGISCSTNGLNGNMISLGAEYSLSKRSALFALYSKLNNGQSSSFRNAENVSPYETGMDVSQVSLGIRHSF